MSPARVKKEKRDVADVEGEPLIYEKTLMKNYLQFLLIFSRPGSKFWTTSLTFVGHCLSFMAPQIRDKC